MQQLFALKDHFLQVRQCLCQANQVTDALLDVGCSRGGEEIYISTSALSPVARGAMCLYRIGIPSVMRILHDQVGSRGRSLYDIIFCFLPGYVINKWEVASLPMPGVSEKK